MSDELLIYVILIAVCVITAISGAVMAMCATQAVSIHAVVIAACQAAITFRPPETRT